MCKPSHAYLSWRRILGSESVLRCTRLQRGWSSDYPTCKTTAAKFTKCLEFTSVSHRPLARTNQCAHMWKSGLSFTHTFFFFFRSHTTDNVSFLEAILWWLKTTNVLIKLMSSVSSGKVAQKGRIKPLRDDTTLLTKATHTHMCWLRCVLSDVEMVFSTWWCFCYLGCQDFKNTELGKNYSLHGPFVRGKQLVQSKLIKYCIVNTGVCIWVR